MPLPDGTFTNQHGHRMEIDHPMVDLDLHEKVAAACQKQHFEDLDKFDGRPSTAAANREALRAVRKRVLEEHAAEQREQRRLVEEKEPSPHRETQTTGD